jgi:uncharacterized protein YaaQ
MALKLAALSFAICAGFAAAAFAEDAAAPVPVPAPLPQNPLPGTRPPDAQTVAPDAARDIQSCLGETGDFISRGNANTYVIGIENKCAQRLKCVIDAYITGAKGPVSVHTVMTLAAKSKKTYAARVKSSGGTAQVSRDCKVL